MIRFAHPEYLFLLWLVGLIAVIIFFEYKWRLSAMRKWAKEPLWDAALPDRAPGMILLKRLLLTGALGMLVLALSGPQVGTKLVEVTREGADVAIAVDVSQSMLTEDITPNRMMKARHEIQKFLSDLRGDRVALVPFAGVAFVQVPLTLDYSAVNSILNALEPGMIPQPGTSLSAAIKQSMRAFSDESKAQRVIILITDGEDHEQGALDEAKEAAKEGVIIYTVGMASPTGGPIPEKDERGRITGYKKDEKGGTVISRLDDKLLSEIAKTTGGEFYRATSVGSEFKDIFRKIAGLDKEQFEAKEYTDYEDRFQWLLSAALILILIAEFLPRSRRKKKQGFTG
ncbi:VWA domain-containing protein [bacterium]|nr:VWA domain-containing protein [bacterium]